jgi:DNA polymerase-3 subunit alpha
MNDDDKKKYIPLRVHSPFSLLEGAIKIPKLADFCKSKGIPACAITDTANLCGAAEFSETLANNGIQPIIGVQANITPINNEQTYENKIINPDILILLVKNKKGYLNLSKIMSISYLASNSAFSPQITIEDLAKNSEGLIALTGGIKGGFGRLLLEGKVTQAEEYLLKLKQIFKSSLYIEISRHDLDDEQKIENEQIQLAYKHNIPLVATNEAFFITEDMFEAHDALLCIADKSYVEETNRRQLTPDFRLKTPQEMINYLRYS